MLAVELHHVVFLFELSQAEGTLSELNALSVLEQLLVFLDVGLLFILHGLEVIVGVFIWGWTLSHDVHSPLDVRVIEDLGQDKGANDCTINAKVLGNLFEIAAANLALQDADT